MHYENFPDGVIVADANGIVTLANHWVRGRHGATSTELVGLPLSRVLPLDDLNGNSWLDFNRPFDGLAIRKRISEQAWYSPHGTEYLVTAMLNRDRPAGEIVDVVVCIRNARVRQQLDREKSDMVAMVAHELRSPLTGIKGFSATLLRRWDAFTEDQRLFMLQTIDADADRLSRLVTELLDAARIDAGRLSLRTEPVQLDQVASRVLESVFSTSETPPTAQVEGPVPVIWGDSDRLTQVLTNIVENAVRHGEGLRELSVRELYRRGKQGVEVSITDQGPGIDEDLRVRVFSRFWRSGPGAGSGLGMFIVRGVVDQHGGIIDIEDASEGGALIKVWLPVNEPDTLTD
ncbi:MAG TPA: PAS domain-containing sensor histidine kinase [Aeromicrobium sp.]|mgnify:CR=1 FL=1|nr:PAS domain-containing sensor histidine kinase [Aeromicrobium sp.]